MLSLEDEQPERIIEVSWGEKQVETYPVEIEISAYDRQGLLRDVTSVLANERVNVTGMSTQSDSSAHTGPIAAVDRGGWITALIQCSGSGTENS